MARTFRRVFINTHISLGQFLITDTRKIHHLLNILRVKRGDKLCLFNESDGEWLAEIMSIKGKTITCDVQKKIRELEEESGIKIAFAPIKQDRLRFLIEKATEIGVDAFIPVTTNRSIVRDVNIHKTHSYITNAVEQSERITVPEITKAYDLKKFLKDYSKDTIIFCNECEQSRHISQIGQKNKYIILVGPEGGFTEEERNLLTSKTNVISVRLIKNILRSETAAIVALSNFIINQYDKV